MVRAQLRTPMSLPNEFHYVVVAIEPELASAQEQSNPNLRFVYVRSQVLYTPAQLDGGSFTDSLDLLLEASPLYLMRSVYVGFFESSGECGDFVLSLHIELYNCQSTSL